MKLSNLKFLISPNRMAKPTKRCPGTHQTLGRRPLIVICLPANEFLSLNRVRHLPRLAVACAPQNPRHHDSRAGQKLPARLWRFVSEGCAHLFLEVPQKLQGSKDSHAWRGPSFFQEGVQRRKRTRSLEARQVATVTNRRYRKFKAMRTSAHRPVKRPGPAPL